MEQKHFDQSTVPNLGRRRFARGGLAAPVVLGTLASKPILGHAGGLQCTVSGNQSGNTSVRGDQAPCNTRGVGPASWLSAQSWPMPLVKGSLTNGNPDIKAASGTEFDGWVMSGATNTYTMSAIFSQTTGGSVGVSSTQLKKAFNTKNGNNPATMLQVLMAAALSTSSAGSALGVATVTSLLNALAHSDYPVSASQIIAMFNSVANGGTYLVGGITPWDQARVTTYFQSLYT